MTLVRLVFALFISVCNAKNWAVIVCGSKGFMNYRHQSNACHAYHTLRRKGIPEEQIVTMSFNDVANAPENPFPGKLFNKPDPSGPGRDVYAGCNVDYEGGDVTRENFVNVLSGVGPGKVVNSTAEDTIFVYFVSHGLEGKSQFPTEIGVGELSGPPLHKEVLHKTLMDMQKARKFRKLVYYLETCYSGSMFEGLEVPDVYAVTSANSTQMGWGTYCHDDQNDIVNGIALNTCLGDGFGVSWMENIDANDATRESFGDQYAAVTKRYNKSHVLQFGDMSLQNETLSMFFGGLASGTPFDEGVIV